MPDTTPRAPVPRPDGSYALVSQHGVVLGIAYGGRHLPAEANARRWAASADLLTALRRHVMAGHVAGCAAAVWLNQPDCSERCRMTRAAIAAASPAAEVPADE